MPSRSTPVVGTQGSGEPLKEALILQVVQLYFH